MATVYSPATSTSTTSTTTTSPVSTHLPLQSRQLRPSKSPLYVPAALRPTERPQRHSPPTPPRSVHGSLDSCDATTTTTTTTTTATELNTTPTTTAPSSPRLATATTATHIQRSDSVSKLAEDEWMKNEHLGSVTGLPTKDHWKADRASPNCDSPTCRSSFGLFLRRHHCRHCGHVFCSSHTPHLVPLDQDARFHPEGVLSRACDLCWHAFHRWDETRGERLTKIQSVIDAQSDSESDVSHDEVAPGSGSSSGPEFVKPDLPVQEIAASIPRGWNWSTF